MTRREAERLKRQQDTLRALGFTQDEAESLRRISMTLQRWHELECGDDNGCIKRDEKTGIPRWHSANDTDRLAGRPIHDRETGAKKRLAAILERCNHGRWRTVPNKTCADAIYAYIQTDPRGAALYIIRPCDVPEGYTVDACYSSGICVY